MKLTAALLIVASVVASVTSEKSKDVVTVPKRVGIVYLIPVFHPNYYEGTKFSELSNDIDAELPGRAVPVHALLLAIPTIKQDEETEKSAPKRFFHSRHRRAAYASARSGGGGGGGGGGGRGSGFTGCQSSSSSSSSSFSSGRGLGGGGGGGGGGGR